MSAAVPALGIMKRSMRPPACSRMSTTSRYQNSVSRPLIRTESVFFPQSISSIALMMLARAAGLSAGATESSRSRLMTSASEAAILAKSSGREPGPNSWQRFGRAGALGGIVKLILGVPG